MIVFSVIATYRRTLLPLLSVVFVIGEKCKEGDVVGDDDFKRSTDLLDKGSDMIYMMNSSMYTFHCCGLVKQLKVYSMKVTDTTVLILRSTGSSASYRVVATLKSSAKTAPKASVSILSSAQAQGNTGDLIGWYAPGPATVPYKVDVIPGKVLMMQGYLNHTYDVDDVLDFTPAKTQTGRRYAIGFVVGEETTGPEFRGLGSSVQTDTSAEVGSSIFQIKTTWSVDLTFTAPPHPFFAIDSSGFVIVKSRLNPGTETVSFTATDLCGMTSSGDVTINVNDVTTTPSTLPTLLTSSSTVNKPTTTRLVKTSSSATTEAKPLTTHQVKATIGDSETNHVTQPTGNATDVSSTVQDETENNTVNWQIPLGICVSIILFALACFVMWCSWRLYRRQLQRNARTRHADDTDKAKCDEDAESNDRKKSAQTDTQN